MRVAFLLASLVFSSFLEAAIPHEGWYVGFMLGPTMLSDLNFNVTNPLLGTPAVGKVTYNTSVNGGVQLGYRVDKLRSELQLMYDKSTFQSIQIGNVSIDSEQNLNPLSMSGNTGFFAALVNLYYEFYPYETEIRFVPYVGLGGGITYVQSSFNLDVYQRQFYAKSATGYAPMGQGIVGINYFISDINSFAVDFRYTTTPKHQRLNSNVAVESVNFVANLSFD